MTLFYIPELKETLTQVRGNIKQKFTDTFRDTIDTIAHLVFPRTYFPQIKDNPENDTISKSQTEIATLHQEELSVPQIGMLNKNNRIDFVLQEAPLEYFNEYLFAITSHVCYWESADTILFIVKDIYSRKGITTDKTAPQHTLNIERDVQYTKINDIEQHVKIEPKHDQL